MAVATVLAITLNIVLLCMIILSLVVVIYYRHLLKQCSNRESDYCYTIQCPVDDPKASPCFGFATRKEINKKGETEFYCSNNPTSAVDAKGKPIKG